MINGMLAKSGIAATLLACAALVAGCSMGDVELNGSVFDKLGVGSNSTRSSTPQVPVRQGLVVPPDLERLPQPGSGDAESTAALGEAMPVDPDQKRLANAAEAQRQHKAYCEKAMQLAKVNRDYRLVKGPLGRCDASVLDNVGISSPVQIQTGGNPPPRTP